MSTPAMAANEKPTTTSLIIVWYLSVVGILVQVLFGGRYGYCRDERSFIAASDHLAAGYVDLAPLSAWLLHVNRAQFGDSLHALRRLPALAFGANTLLTGYIARELGPGAGESFSPPRRSCVRPRSAPTLRAFP